VDWEVKRYVRLPDSAATGYSPAEVAGSNGLKESLGPISFPAGHSRPPGSGTVSSDTVYHRIYKG
jgi:hypothetical protein